MDHISIQEILSAFRNEDSKVLRSIYFQYFPGIKRFVLAGNGEIADAEDVFQDALLLIYLKIKDNTIHLHCDFGSFLFCVARHLWLRERKRRLNVLEFIPEYAEIPDPDTIVHNDCTAGEKRDLILEHLDSLGEDCKKLLLLYLDNIPEDKIAKIMGYHSVQYTRNRRTACKEKLVRKIWESQKYSELSNSKYSLNTKIPRW